MFFLFWGAGFNVLLGLRSGNYLGNLMKCWGEEEDNIWVKI